MPTPSTTRANYGDPSNMVQQAAGLFTAHMQRNSMVASMTGPMPKGTAGASATLRKQTTQHMPIVTTQDLGKGDGDEVTFHLLNPMKAKPIMGSAWAEGRGTAMSLAQDKLRVNQARFPVSLGDSMTDIRSPADFRALGRPAAQNLLDRYMDQTLMVHMAGARGFQDNMEWVVPTTDDPDFARIMVNTVKAPTKNRHFLADATDSVKPFQLASSDVDLGTTDVFTIDTVDAMRSVLDSMALPPPGIQIPGDAAAEDSPLRLWLLSPAQFDTFAASSTYRTYQANALARAAQAKQHPLFLGPDTALWNGFLLKKMPRPIRFYAGNQMKYCASFTSETESTAPIASALTAGQYAVDRSVILGGQAVAHALAASKQSGIPFFWSEKELDHGDKVELLIGAIRGVSKVRFAVAGNDGADVITDYGVTVVDTVVKTPGGVQ
jgi:N4-gp56 family major capsid protein